jgi:hypothetical protein
MVRFRVGIVVACVIVLVCSLSAVLVGLSSAPAGAAASSSTPQCTFNGSSLPLVGNASAGKKIVVDCTGLPALHPYLMMETSLLLGIDPNAAPLLDGQIVSVSGLLALLDALPEIDPGAIMFPVSNLSGDLDFTYTLPTYKAADPNAVCGPTHKQINAGLIGCALATIDLTSFKPVGAASGVIEYAGDPLFPPSPTLALGTTKATVGQSVSVSDKAGATHYWWLSTLVALESLLGGGSAPTPTITVSLSRGRTSVDAPDENITVTPASYVEPTLTPPKISGSFTVPKGATGRRTVTVTYVETLLGFPLANEASAVLTVK